jgi:flagellar biosynthesis protein FliR
MRMRLAVGTLLILVPTFAHAQVNEETKVPEAVSPSGVPSMASTMPSTTSSRSHAPCCATKGALIGLAIGVGTALVMGGAYCDGSGCAAKALGAAAVLGVMGAGIGAMVAPSIQGSIALPGGRRVAVVPVLSPHAAGGIVAVRLRGERR